MKTRCRSVVVGGDVIVSLPMSITCDDSDSMSIDFSSISFVPEDKIRGNYNSRIWLDLFLQSHKM